MGVGWEKGSFYIFYKLLLLQFVRGRNWLTKKRMKLEDRSKRTDTLSNARVQL